MIIMRESSEGQTGFSGRFSRLNRIPPYLFSSLDTLKGTVKRGLIDLSEGNPDLPPPKELLTVFRKALKKTENHRYPTYAGKLTLRAAVARYYQRRFGVTLAPETEVVVLLGSKEGAAHLIWAICDSQDRVGVCDPGYPLYFNQIRLCGATPVVLPLEEKKQFLFDLDLLTRHAPNLKLLCLNYPNNPTTAVAPMAFYQKVVDLALKYGFYIVNDNVYSEIYFNSPPISILQIPNARQCCVELNSLSKTFSVPGWRIGMAVGNPMVLRALLKIKQNIDSGPFGAIQDVAVFALNNYQRFSEKIRAVYQKRRDVFTTALNSQGWEIKPPPATFYIWAKLPKKWQKGEGSSYTFVTEMLKKCRVLSAPGEGFGSGGEGFVRFALIAPERRLLLAAKRIGRWLKRNSKG